MPSSLRYQVSPSSSINKSVAVTAAQKKQKMSLTQTYFLAHTARAKLSKEASRAEHNLFRLVHHANLLDNLMLDLAEAERRSEEWFSDSLKLASSSEPKHIQWADKVPTITEDYAEDSSDDESDEEEDDDTEMLAPLRRVPSPPARITTVEVESDEEDSDEEEDEDEDEESLQLTRTPSPLSPPELLHGHESDSDSDDDSMPPSPPPADIPLDAFSAQQKRLASGKAQKQSASLAPSNADDEDSFYDEGFYLPQRQAIPAY